MSLDANHKAFLDIDLTPFAGQWVAISDGQLIAHDNDFSKLAVKVKGLHLSSRPLFASVPKGELLLF